MKKWLLPGALVAVLAVAVIGGGFVPAGGFGDDDNDARAERDTTEDGDAAKCLPDAPDCEPTGDIDPAAGACLSQDDPAYNPDEPCSDTGAGPGLGMCAVGVTDCVDTVVEPICAEGEEDCTDIVGGDAGGCASDDPAQCEGRFVELVFADLEKRVPGVEITVKSVEFTEWSDASLGNPQPGEAYAQVITPGFKIVLTAGGEDYEYHTDLQGAFTLLD